MAEQLTESYEDYIEAIYKLSETSGRGVRSVDVACELGFSKASVARAMKNLREAGYIDQQHYGDIMLTEKGKEIGKAVLTRHRTLTRFLAEILDVDPAVANEEACRIEHTVSQDTMDKWTAWLDAQTPAAE